LKRIATPAAVMLSKFRVAWRIARAVVVGYLLVVLAMMFLEESFIFFPSKFPDGNYEAFNGQFEDARFRAADGTELHGWYLAHERPRAVILYAHGNAGNLSHRGELVLEMNRRLRASVMVFDYRGYGRSQGSPNEAGILADARAAREWLADRAGVSKRALVLFGESIGGAVAIDLAAAEGARGLIVENAFTSLPDVAARHYPWLPVRLLTRTRFDSANKIADYHGPFLAFHGDADTIVPYELGAQLFAAANEPNRMVNIAGGDHNDPRREEFYRAVIVFLDQVAP
jgi:fermentation-respiration switch protein FrsA (DUF1100 family)